MKQLFKKFWFYYDESFERDENLKNEKLRKNENYTKGKVKKMKVENKWKIDENLWKFWK